MKKILLILFIVVGFESVSWAQQSLSFTNFSYTYEGITYSLSPSTPASWGTEDVFEDYQLGMYVDSSDPNAYYAKVFLERPIDWVNGNPPSYGSDHLSILIRPEGSFPSFDGLPKKELWVLYTGNFEDGMSIADAMLSDAEGNVINIKDQLPQTLKLSDIVGDQATADFMAAVFPNIPLWSSIGIGGDSGNSALSIQAAVTTDGLIMQNGEFVPIFSVP